MEGPSRKRMRLSMACNTCRQRKVKCDASYPKCRRCQARNEECHTTSTREPDVEIKRTWLDLPEPALSPITPASSAIREPEPALSIQQMPNQPGPPHVRPSDGNDVDAWLDTLDVSYNTDHNTQKTKMLGVSSVQCLVKSVEVYLRSDGRGTVLEIFKYGMPHAEELHLDASCSFMTLPTPNSSDQAWDAFVQHVYLLYPLYDLRNLRQVQRRFQQSPHLSSTAQQDLPLLMSVYLLTSIGLDDAAGSFTTDGTRYLQAAAHLLGPVILTPYLSTVQCLLLMAIVCRGRNKGGVAWQMLGTAIRIGQSLGLHQLPALSCPQSEGGSLASRIWGIATALEKMMQLECGRPSLLECNAEQAEHVVSTTGRVSATISWLALADIQGEINELIYKRSLKGRSTSDFLDQVGTLDAKLLSFDASLAPHLRFNEAHAVSSGLTAHVAMQYHAAFLALHRAALVAPSSFYKAAVEKHCNTALYKDRVRRGESICSASAQAIARITIELTEQNAYTNCLSADAPLLACTALAVLVLKGSSKLLRATNYEVRLCLTHDLAIADQDISCSKRAQR
jgi:hypothetical protein